MSKNDKSVKLSYKKMSDTVLEIDLNNGYSVIVFILFNKGSGNYKVTYFLKDNNMNTLEKVNNLEEIFVCNIGINSAILNGLVRNPISFS